MIQITLNVTAAQLALIASIMNGDEVVQTVEPAKEPAPRKAAAKSEEKVETKAETKAEPEVKGKDAAGEDVAEVPSLEDVTAAAKMYAAKNGRDALASLMEKHGGKNVSSIPEGKRQGFIDEASA